jgi:hypothetical protein
MTENELITYLLHRWPDIVGERYRINHCIMATRAAIEVGHYFGYTWHPLVVNIAVFNQAGFELFQQGIPFTDWPAEAHSVGVISQNTTTATGWDGHLLARAGDILIDLAGAQFDRPGKDIAIGPWTFKVEGEGPWPGLRDGTHLIVWPQTGITVYRRTRDWKTNFAEPAAQLIRELKVKEKA